MDQWSLLTIKIDQLQRETIDRKYSNYSLFLSMMSHSNECLLMIFLQGQTKIFPHML